MSDNEDATAALWNSEVLSVKNAVGEPIPAFGQDVEERAEIVPARGAKDSRHVLPNNPPGTDSESKMSEFDGQVATRIIQSRSLSGDAEALAGCSSDKKVNWSTVLSYGCEVAEIGNAGKAMCKNRRREWLNLRKESGLPPERFPRDGCGFDA